MAKRTMGNLPDELIEEILLRLPVKFIKRFQSVCPSWNTLFRSPAFVKSHAERRKDSKKLMVSSDETHFYSYSVNCGQKGVVAVSKIPKIDHHGVNKIVGSCDGLLLVTASINSFPLWIWNPTTRESKQLPALPGDKSIHNPQVLMCGFGSATSLDKKNYNNYKVLIIDRASFSVFVYATRTNFWRRIKDLPYNAEGPSFVLAKGNLHFYAHDFNSDRKRVLLGFDIGDEELKEVVEPDYGGGYSHSKQIIELKGSLCLLSYHYQMSYEYCVWVMKNYGEKESWTNMFCINILNIPDGKSLYYFELLHVYTDGKILLGVHFQRPFHSALAYYDSKNHKAELVLDGAASFFPTISYAETLVSPKVLL